MSGNILKHPTLFSKTVKDSLQIWYIEQEDNKLRTVSGLMDGQKVTSDWTVCYGKSVGKINETSPVDQCTKDIKSRYKKQLKTGYSDNILNAGETSYIYPMQAWKFVDYRDKLLYKNGLAIDIKYNGMKNISSSAGFHSREGEKILTAPHIQRILKPLHEKYPNLVLDGELYNHEYRYRLNDLMKIVRKTVNITPSLLADSEQKVKYYVYDGYGFDDVTENTPFYERRAKLNKLIENIQYMVPVTYDMAYSEEEILALYNKHILNGYEGIIIRVNNPKYEHRRTVNMLKLKPTDDAEFKLIDIQEGEGNWAGKACIITLQMEDGRTFNASFKGKFEQAEECLKNKNFYIGKMVTIFYNGLTGKGIPNFAKFDINNWNNDKK